MERWSYISLLFVALLFGSTQQLRSAEGAFRLRLNCKAAIECGAISKGDTIAIKGFTWGELSTAPLSYGIVKGRSIILTLQNAKCGEYVVELRKRAGGRVRNIMEFFVSDAESHREERYAISYKNDAFYAQALEGAAENGLLAELNASIRDYAAGKIDNGQAKEALDSIYSKALASDSSALFTSLCRLSLDNRCRSVRYIRSVLPLEDPRVLYTNFVKSSVESYLKSLERNSTEALTFIAEDLVQSAHSTLKPYIALQIFNLFKEAEIMGQEAVAVEIAKRYLLNDKSGSIEEMLGYEAYFGIMAFVQMNEHSLIGMQAPQIELPDSLGCLHSIPECGEGADEASPSLQLFYFYTSNCSSCRATTPLLAELLQHYSGIPIKIYAIFTGSSRSEWMSECAKFSLIKNPLVERIDLWDPEVESNFPLLYGVISTPQMLLTTDKGIIVGRRLTPKSLEQLLEAINEN
ncbi:MAG: hypothetical protein SPH62_04425 [Candidatus Egerieousia sp.]|nr:hypothetical protein [bacterium]MDY5255637.1 hypothetical protein [Candidatus Egerieousia sp.]